MHLPSLSQLIVFGTGYVTVASAAVNLLPKDEFLDGYPRAKTAYNAAIKFLALSALNIRKCLPGLNLNIPGLGFGKSPDSSTPNPPTKPGAPPA